MDHSVASIAHICEPHFCGLDGMRGMYAVCKVCPTSEHGDIMLIRSHIAYWGGAALAERAVIKPSRGHSYRVNGSVIVKISDHYDHREGVTGWRYA